MRGRKLLERIKKRFKSDTRIEAFRKIMMMGVRVDGVERPIAVIDGEAFPIKMITKPIFAENACIFGITDVDMRRLCENLNVKRIEFSDMRVSDVGPLEHIDGLKELAIHWNTKLVDLSPIGKLTDLELLLLDDTKKVNELAPLGNLKNLIAFEYSGGMWSKNMAKSLKPISGLEKLEHLILTNLKVEKDGLLPIASLKNLKRLRISNQFKTSDYAFLSVKLPTVECDNLCPYTRLWPRSQISGGRDVMVTGSRKPFLNSKKDAVRLQKYVDQFEVMQKKFKADMAI